MLASLVVSGGAVYFISNKFNLNDLLSNSSTPISVAAVPSKPAAENQPAPADIQKESAPAVAVAAAPAVPATRNILFRFPRPSAKSVFIIGDFNDWKRTAMEKNEKGWDLTIPLTPGSYKYMFVVDEKRIKDPNNKVAQDGKSVINVKPLQ
jgi:hypothetical protein